MIKKSKFLRFCSVNYGEGEGQNISLPTSHGSEQCRSVGDFSYLPSDNKEGKK